MERTTQLATSNIVTHCFSRDVQTTSPVLKAREICANRSWVGSVTSSELPRSQKHDKSIMKSNLTSILSIIQITMGTMHHICKSSVNHIYILLWTFLKYIFSNFLVFPGLFVRQASSSQNCQVIFSPIKVILYFACLHFSFQ